MIDKSHGSPYDRGGADAWYHRGRHPHKYPNGTYNPPKVTELTEQEIAEYHQGFDDHDEGPRGGKQWD